MKSPLDPSLPYRAPLGNQNMYQQVPNQMPQVPFNAPQQNYQQYMPQGQMQQMHPYQQPYQPNMYGQNYQQPYYQVPQQLPQQPRALSPNVGIDQDYLRRVEERNRQLMAANVIPQNMQHAGQYDQARMQRGNTQQNGQPLKASREAERPNSKNQPSKVVPPTQSICINPQGPAADKKMTQEEIQRLKMQKYQKEMIEYQQREAMKNQQQQQQFIRQQEEAMRALQMKKQQQLKKQEAPKLVVPDKPPEHVKNAGSPMPLPVPIVKQPKQHAKLQPAKPSQQPQPQVPQTSPIVKQTPQPQPQTPQTPPALKQTPQPHQIPNQAPQQAPMRIPPPTQVFKQPPPNLTPKSPISTNPSPVPIAQQVSQQPIPPPKLSSVTDNQPQKQTSSTPSYEVVKSRLKVTRDKIDNLINRQQQQLAAVEQLILKQKQRGLPNRNKALFLVKQRRSFNQNIENLRTRHQVIIKTLQTITQQNMNKQMVDSLDQANKYMQEVQQELEKKDWRQVLMDVHLNSKEAQQLTEEMGVGMEQQSQVDQLYKELELKVKKEQEKKKLAMVPPLLTPPVMTQPKVMEVPKLVTQPQLPSELPTLTVGPPQQAMKVSAQLQSENVPVPSNLKALINTSVIPPKLSNIAPSPSNIVPNSSTMAPKNTSHLAPTASNLVPKSSNIVPNLSDATGNSARSDKTEETASQFQNKLKKEPSLLPINKLPLTNSTLIQIPPPPPEPLQFINLPSTEQLPEEQIEMPPSLVHPSVVKAPVFPNNKVSSLQPPSQMGVSLNYSQSQKSPSTLPKATQLPVFPSVLQAPPAIFNEPVHPSKAPSTSFLAQPLPSVSAFVFGSSMMRDPAPQSK